MKCAPLSVATLALFAQRALAFPMAELEEAYHNTPRNERLADAQARAAKVLSHEAPVKRQVPGAVPPFDAEQQYVSNKGQYTFVAPSGDDQRGPCPGLNSMANHNYMPHNGIGDFNDFVSGTAAVFGMGADLAGFLAIYGAVFDGDLTQYSIGGPYKSLTNLNGLLGSPSGLSGSHNKYEGDVSPTRGDLFQYGNDYLVQMSQFKALYSAGRANNDNVDLGVLNQRRYERFEESVHENPYFFNAPFSGVVASPAAWSFVYRFMANKSEEYPEGRLDGETLKSFYSITGDYPDFAYTAGHERIPDNWYKRNLVDYYTIPYFALDAAAAALEHPQFATLGGNTGTPDSFVGVDPGDLTDGTYNSGNILKDNNAICFGIEATLMQLPDLLTGLYSDTDEAMSKLGPHFNNATNALGCPQLNKINKGQFDKYPGYAKLNKDGTYSSSS